MDDAMLKAAILDAAYQCSCGDGEPVYAIAGHVLAALAASSGRPLRLVEQTACDAGVMPARYLRNARQISVEQQARLLRARVLLVGLGGLGGHVLDMLLRMGVGTIVGADGDVFEESNLNRQLLSSVARVGMSKAEAGVLHATAVNPATTFTPVCAYLRGDELAAQVQGADVVVDALGGLADRVALQAAASSAGIPLVTAGVAGFSGWVATVYPGETGPADMLGRDNSAEDVLGNIAPTVAFAASLQASGVMRLLIGNRPSAEMLLFDLSDCTFVKMPLF